MENIFGSFELPLETIDEHYADADEHYADEHYATELYTDEHYTDVHADELYTNELYTDEHYADEHYYANEIANEIANERVAPDFDTLQSEAAFAALNELELNELELNELEPGLTAFNELELKELESNELELKELELDVFERNALELNELKPDMFEPDVFELDAVERNALEFDEAPVTLEAAVQSIEGFFEHVPSLQDLATPLHQEPSADAATPPGSLVPSGYVGGALTGESADRSITPFNSSPTSIRNLTYVYQVDTPAASNPHRSGRRRTFGADE